MKIEVSHVNKTHRLNFHQPYEVVKFWMFCALSGCKEEVGRAYGRSICGKETASGNHFNNVEKTESRNQRVEHIIDFILRLKKKKAVIVRRLKHSGNNKTKVGRNVTVFFVTMLATRLKSKSKFVTCTSARRSCCIGFLSMGPEKKICED